MNTDCEACSGAGWFEGAYPGDEVDCAMCFGYGVTSTILHYLHPVHRQPMCGAARTLLLGDERVLAPGEARFMGTHHVAVADAASVSCPTCRGYVDLCDRSVARQAELDERLRAADPAVRSAAEDEVRAGALRFVMEEDG